MHPHQTAILGWLLFTATISLAQQRVANPDDRLAAILSKAEANIQAYQASVPNVYCTEHAVAKRKVANSAQVEEIAVPGGSMPLDRSATVENTAESTSIFRLKRLDKPSDTGIFDESRILQKVTYSADAPGYEEIAIPERLYGIFSNGLNILSTEASGCFRFELKKSSHRKEIVVNFKDLPPDQRASGCPVTSDGKGTIRIDPATMHVTEIERNLPRYRLVSDIEGSWEWQETYSPVELKSGTYWLPASITSRSVSADHRRTWTYSATYQEYHLFFSTTRILPGASF